MASKGKNPLLGRKVEPTKGQREQADSGKGDVPFNGNNLNQIIAQRMKPAGIPKLAKV